MADHLASRRNVFGFLDETGLIHAHSDRYFGLGLLVAERTGTVHRRLISFINRKRFFDELKFSLIKPYNLKLYVSLVDLFFDCPNVRFYGAVYDKTSSGLMAEFGSRHDTAYNACVGRLVKSSLDVNERMALLADDVSTVKSNNYEAEMSREAAEHRGGEGPIFGVCRISSKAVVEIQLVDVLLGAVVHGIKVRNNETKFAKDSAKYALVKHIESRMNGRNNPKFTVSRF